MQPASRDVRKDLSKVLLVSPWHATALDVLREYGGEEAWIAAGFVRNAVWDGLHGREPESPEDVDVLILDRDPAAEGRLQDTLAAASPEIPWSVRNQARMHARHGDAPYSSLAQAMRRWPETATAVAVRLDAEGGLWILAPFGLNDLMQGVLRPSDDSNRCRTAFDDRLRRKEWLKRWPGLTVREPRFD